MDVTRSMWQWYTLTMVQRFRGDNRRKKLNGRLIGPRDVNYLIKIEHTPLSAAHGNNLYGSFDVNKLDTPLCDCVHLWAI